MGTASFVVTGKGNALALRSTPARRGPELLAHGGAEAVQPRVDSTRAMAGIAWGQSDAFLDEHPEAYKPIDTVMADAADLVSIGHTLRQVVNVKGN